MPFNQLKKYDDFLELNHYSARDKIDTLKAIFKRDISENENFKFQGKIIRPLKKEDEIDVESLFKHLTHRSVDETDDKGKKIKKRDVFDVERSKRLHWIDPHINEKILEENIKIFSAKIRKSGKWVIRTYIYNKPKSYVLILEPQRSGKDYYFITAYYLEKKYGGAKSIKNIYRRKLDDVH